MTPFGAPPYGMTHVLGKVSHSEAVEKTTDALASQGFGILTTIDMTATLRAKRDVELGRPYTILGACNPDLAYRAYLQDPGIGLLLPCNVVVTEDERGTVVSVADPEVVFETAHLDALVGLSFEVKARLTRALDALAV